MISALILLPIVAGLLSYAFPKSFAAQVKWFGAGVAALSLIGVVLAYGMPDETHAWLARPFVAAFHVGVGTGPAFWLALLLTLCTTCALLATRLREQRNFVAQILLLEGAMLALFLARDLLLFALAWDLMLIPVFILLVGTGGAAHAAWRYLIYNVTAGLALLLATAVYGVIFGSTDVIGRSGLPPIGGLWQTWVFAGFAFAFLVKTPVWPFHTWMPDAYAQSPSPLAAIISAVQSKGGLYGFLVIALPLFPDAAHAAAPYMIALGLIGLVYGAFASLVQDDIKKIAAYSSLSHLGLILVAIFSFNAIAIAGALVYLIAHGLFSATLFLVMGFVEQREETRSLKRLGGLGGRNPRLAGAFSIAALAALGLPGLAGFAGELLIVIGLYGAGFVWPATIALVAIVLASAYMLRLFQDAMQGREVPDLPQRPDLSWTEGIALAPLVLALVLLGIYPQPLIASTPHTATTVSNAGGVR